MNIIFTDHAKTRMFQRKITEAEIKSAIDNPDAIKETFKNRMVIRKTVSRGTLEVIYRQSEGKSFVITCYWIKEA